MWLHSTLLQAFIHIDGLLFVILEHIHAVPVLYHRLAVNVAAWQHPIDIRRPLFDTPLSMPELQRVTNLGDGHLFHLALLRAANFCLLLTLSLRSPSQRQGSKVWACVRGRWANKNLRRSRRKASCGRARWSGTRAKCVVACVMKAGGM